MNWYAVFMETGFEEYLQNYLRGIFSDFHSLIPKRVVPEKRNGKYEKILKKLFPGYVLIHTKLDDEVYYRIRSVPHVIKILGNGTNYSPIDEAEIATLLRLLDNDGIIDYSEIFITNSIIQVKRGPLKGLEGMIVRVNTHTQRAKVKFNFMGQFRIFEVGIELLEMK